MKITRLLEMFVKFVNGLIQLRNAHLYLLKWIKLKSWINLKRQKNKIDYFQIGISLDTLLEKK